jgi:hypothetical protein
MVKEVGAEKEHQEKAGAAKGDARKAVGGDPRVPAGAACASARERTRTVGTRVGESAGGGRGAPHRFLGNPTDHLLWEIFRVPRGVRRRPRGPAAWRPSGAAGGRRGRAGGREAERASQLLGVERLRLVGSCAGKRTTISG